MLAKLLADDQGEQKSHESRSAVYSKSRIKARTKQNLWNVKLERPELFATEGDAKKGKGGTADTEDGPPAGFEPCGQQGWLHHPARGLFLEVESGRRLWFDAAANEYKEFHEGSVLALQCISGVAANLGAANRAPAGARNPVTTAKGCNGGSSSSTSAAGAAIARAPAPRHILVPDLHRTAKALKADIDHLDQPASLIFVLGVGADARAAATEAASLTLHVRLIRRLAAFRGHWSDEALCSAAAGALTDIAESHGGVGPLAAVAMLLGQRVVTAAASGAAYFIAKTPMGSVLNLDASTASTVSSQGAETMETACVQLEDVSETICLALVAGEASIGNEDIQASAMTSQLMVGRPRAASVALLQEVRNRNDVQPLVAVCARLGSAPDAPAIQFCRPAAKRQKVEETAGKVRVRQILLLHWRGIGPEPVDPIRRKPVRRTPEEADMEMMKVLEGLVKDGCAGFSNICKATSECPSALKGGELAGDLGWLDRDKGVGSQQAGGRAVKLAIPAAVLKAAFELEVGQLSDLISSDIGIHLLLRSA